MAQRQDFIVGQDNPITDTSLTAEQLKAAWDRYTILRAAQLNGIFNSVSKFSKLNSDEIANAILSITGSEPTGNSSDELAQALQLMRQEIETTSLTFKGYVSTSEPSSSTYTLVTGNIWINSATMPTSFPVAAASIKQWDGTAWVNYGSTYTPADFDFFRNINDNEGYYWFGGMWTVMSTDMSTTYFTLNQSTGKWEIKSSVKLPGTPTVGTAPDVNDSSNKVATTGWARNLATPVGTIAAFGGTSAPSGWLVCDGSAISRTTYANLFDVIGTSYGSGDGSTTFNLPTQSVLPLGTKVVVKRKSNADNWYAYKAGTNDLAQNSSSTGTYAKMEVRANGFLGNKYQTSSGFTDENISFNPNGGLIVDLTQATDAQAIVCIRY